MKRTATAAILGVLAVAPGHSAVAAPASEVPPVTTSEGAKPDATSTSTPTAAGTKSEAASDAAKPGATSTSTPTAAGTKSEVASDAAKPDAVKQDASGTKEVVGDAAKMDATTGYGTSVPPVAPRPQPLDAERRWMIRQAPLAGAEPSWGPPGQVPEYAEIEGPAPAPKGPPSRGTPRIVTGAILGPAGLALTIAGIVGASTRMLGDYKNLSAPMIGAGLVTTAIGAALLADGILRRQRFLRWQAKQGEVSLRPAAAPGRFAGATLVWRF